MVRVRVGVRIRIRIRVWVRARLARDERQGVLRAQDRN